MSLKMKNEIQQNIRIGNWVRVSLFVIVLAGLFFLIWQKLFSSLLPSGKGEIKTVCRDCNFSLTRAHTLRKAGLRFAIGDAGFWFQPNIS